MTFLGREGIANYRGREGESAEKKHSPLERDMCLSSLLRDLRAGKFIGPRAGLRKRKKWKRTL